MQRRLQEIDEFLKPDHTYLLEDDECYFLVTYTSGKNFAYSPDNSLISNFKKGVERKSLPDWKYKVQAIDNVSGMLKEVDLLSVFGNSITIVPIPPSKCKTDPEYDDRLIQVLEKVCEDKIDYRDLIIQKESTTADHTTDKRKKPEELLENYEIDESLTEGVQDILIIFDDMVTNGAHYKAVKQKLQERFPDKPIKGLFIARREFPEDLTEENFV